MIGRGSGRGAWILVGVLALPCLAPRAASAQQWHELYADGVAALRRGEAREAVDRLRRAIEKRPRPGVRVPTYGTNFEAQYFPYLRLAEAYLLLDAPEEAATALQTSARLGVEPEEERSALQARVDALLEAKRPPPEPTPTPTPTPPPTPAPAAPPEGAVTPPEPTTVAPPPAPTPVPAAVSPPPATPTPSAGREGARDRAPAGAREPPATGPRLSRLDITSDPPGAQVFLDDEPVGRTDPETGRLRLRELAPGRHRLRLSSGGRGDFIREIQVAGEPVAVEAVLPLPPAPAATPSAEPPPAAAVAVGPLIGAGVLAALVIGLVLWRLARSKAELVTPRETPRSGEFPGDPGTDESFPIPFGGYSLVRRIGKGGMAAVYEATRGGESFALKRPLSGFLDDDRFRERFLREAELGRTLHHPNIIRIFDRGQVGDVPYFVMELIRGETLRARLERDGRLDATLAARWTAQVAEALDYAHNKGVIHRDLKPSNIMIEEAGGVKVMDYGVARAQRLEGLTTTGSFLGTPSYAAPETVDAGAQPQSDLYSLGVIFFEMLTGSLPFQGESAFAILRRHVSTPPPTPSALNYSLPEAVDRLVLRLLSKEPSDRPTAEELLNELADFLGTAR